jgi:[ribosomal protein S5]-alanine N-acetyltransferase
MAIELRTYRFSDEPALVRHANNPRIAANVRDAFPVPYTPADACKWISFCLGESSGNHINRVITLDDELIGGIGLVRQQDIYRFNAEVGYWLAEPYWGRGYVTEALRRFSDEAFAGYRIHRLYAGVFSTNAASMRVLEKAGYHPEAVHKEAIYKNGTYLNEHLYVKFSPLIT